MSEESESSEKSQALRDSAARLIHESRRLREASERLMKEAKEVKKLVPEKPREKDGEAKP